MTTWEIIFALLTALIGGYGVGYTVASEREWERARRYLHWMWQAREEEAA